MSSLPAQLVVFPPDESANALVDAGCGVITRHEAGPKVVLEKSVGNYQPVLDARNCLVGDVPGSIV